MSCAVLLGGEERVACMDAPTIGGVGSNSDEVVDRSASELVKQSKARAGEEVNEEDRRWMREALLEARAAFDDHEIPCGAVLVKNGSVIARGHNQTNHKENGSRHAEIEALDNFVDQHGGAEALRGATLYVNCEPCIMCAAALRIVGVQRVVFGCANDRFGGNGSLYNIHSMSECALEGADLPPYEATGGIFADESIELFREFYTRGNAKAPPSKRARRSRSSPTGSDVESTGTPNS